MNICFMIVLSIMCESGCKGWFWWVIDLFGLFMWVKELGLFYKIDFEDWYVYVCLCVY